MAKPKDIRSGRYVIESLCLDKDIQRVIRDGTSPILHKSLRLPFVIGLGKCCFPGMPRDCFFLLPSLRTKEAVTVTLDGCKYSLTQSHLSISISISFSFLIHPFHYHYDRSLGNTGWISLEKACSNTTAWVSKRTSLLVGLDHHRF